MQDAPRVVASIGGEGPVHPGVDRRRVVADAEFERLAVRAKTIEGEHGLVGGDIVVVHLHGAVAAGGEGVAGVVVGGAGVGHGDAVGGGVGVGPELDVATRRRGAGDHARHVREDVEIGHVLLEDGTGGDRGHAEFHLAGGERVHRCPHILDRLPEPLGFHVIGHAGKRRGRGSPLVEGVGRAGGVEIATHGDFDRGHELIGAGGHADIGDDFRRQRGGADGDGGIGHDPVGRGRAIAHAADRESERRAGRLGGGEQGHVALVGREGDTQNGHAAIEREVFRSQRGRRERFGKVDQHLRAAERRRRRGQRGCRGVAGGLDEHLQGFDREAAGVVGKRPVHAVVDRRGVIADADIEVARGGGPAPVVEREDGLACGRIVELHGPVGARRALVAKVKQGVARAHHPGGVGHLVVGRPKFQVARQARAGGETRDV